MLRKKSMIVATLILLAVISSPFTIAFKSMSATAYETSTSASSSINVSGRISTNTTWTLPNSPYIVVDDVVVETDVFLTIEPGVVVKFASGKSLIVDGALVAQGNSTHPISFTSNSSTPNHGDWGTIRFRDTSIDKACVIDWAILEYANAGVTTYKSSPKISTSIIRYNVKGFYSESEGIARISNSVVHNNTYGIEGSFSYYYYYSTYPRSEISNSRITNNTYGVNVGSGYLMIRESTVSNNTYGVWAPWGGTVQILGSDVSYNTHGVVASSITISKSIISNNDGTGISPGWYSYYPPTKYYYDGTFSISYSTITGNKENGIVSKAYGTNTIHFSNIYGNTPYDISNLSPNERNADVNATNNWWGTTGTTEIDQHIYDYYDDFNLRKVLYQPFLDHSVTIPPSAHDVAITSVTASPTSVEAGQSVYITINIVNEGDFDENVAVTALYDSVKIGEWTYMYGPLPAGASTTASFSWYTWGVQKGDYTISAEANIVPDETDIADNRFIDGIVTVTGPLRPPYASFTFQPPYPSVDEPVTFDASASYDPDGSLVDYIWNYGDTTTGRGKITTHLYTTSGTYAVILKVTDDEGLNGTTIQYVTVLPTMLVHDIAITDVKASPTRVIPGDPTTITVTVENQGDFTETFTVTTFYDDTAAAPSQTVTNLAAKTSTTLSFTWHTSGVGVGEYTIRAAASTVLGEGDTSDNTFVDGKIAIAHRKLSVKLTGEFDYLRMEQVSIRLAALVRDAETAELVSNAVVNVEIYDATGTLWISATMLEKISGSGIYEWTSAGTIGQLRLSKGVYLIRAGASFRSGPTAYDILEFHIDPPEEGTNEILYYIAFTVIALAGATGLILKRQPIINRLHQPKQQH